MKTLDLAGMWQFQEVGKDKTLEGHLPGCNYLDLINAGEIEDPFWGQNETAATQIAERDFLYSRKFMVDDDLLQSDQVELVVSGLDTLAVITLNGTEIANCDNAHRTYRLPIKPQLVKGKNELSIYFSSPLPYIRAKNKENPLYTIGMADNAAHIRKPQCHFGWDWGPNLAPVGIHGSIKIEGYNQARITNLAIEQKHTGGQVELTVCIDIDRYENFSKPLDLRYSLVGPDGSKQLNIVPLVKEHTCFIIRVEHPKLWWCNGLGDQPLYELTVELVDEKYKKEPLDSWKRKIGLRTIRLDNTADKWGRNFCFVVNDVPIFAKGGDWIPSDSFVTRTTRDDLDFYIKSARDANMNMLRVWGGGYYESDTFYELCDEYGILVWQDFAFACAEYPLNDPAFLENVKLEVIDNIRRLRHHASLALWCGNNEIKLMSMSFKKTKQISHDDFFYHTLKEWVASEDNQTPYWSSSPSSSVPEIKANSLNDGDTHLWHVWHGLQPLESFRNYPTRFCSEFGVESLPNMHTIRSFTDAEKPTLFDPVMQLHQKSIGGNEKMLFYVLSKYRNPSTLESFIYLSQLIQSETVRMATEFWRRNVGRCNGAIYWQYNDCWPVASWAGIDYQKQYKAVQYRARHFNKMVCVSAEMHQHDADVSVINDLPVGFLGSLNWRLVDFSGNTIHSETIKVSIEKNCASKVETISFKQYLGDFNKQDAALILELMDLEDKIISSQSNLLVPDKEASLRKPNLKTSVSVVGKEATLTITADTFTRFAYVEIDGVHTPLSDNFIDIEGGKSVHLTFAVPEGRNSSDLEKGIRILSMADVDFTGTLLQDKLWRLKTRFSKNNLIFWFVFKFLI